MPEDSTGVDGTPPCISLGVIAGDPHPDTTVWSELASQLSRDVKAERADVESPLNLDLVFVIGGEFLELDFAGTRPGRYSKKHNLLMVEIAIDREHGGVDVDRRGVLVEGLKNAISTAEAEGHRRGLFEGPLAEIRQIVENVEKIAGSRFDEKPG